MVPLAMVLLVTVSATRDILLIIKHVAFWLSQKFIIYLAIHTVDCMSLHLEDYILTIFVWYKTLAIYNKHTHDDIVTAAF